MLVEHVKNMLSAAILTRDETRKSILKVLLSDIQRLHGEVTDKQVITIARKLIEGNNEMLKYKPEQPHLKNEIAILEELMPKMLSKDEIAKLVTPEVMGAILASKNDGQANGALIKFLNTSKVSFDNVVAIELVKELRSAKS